MSYLVLARKWRPQTFHDLVGQEHVRRTLENAIAQNRVAHAFLFTGVRGVGKTTSARILAKALNCAKGPTATPCLECPQCLDIAAGTDMDVRELDAASNNGVDEVRRLQEELPYRPTRDRFKIYIVDEVHMLSSAAWNAFLKTLEEPPAHVKFIFATTEVHKVPITILSRCQRYDFKMISAQTIAGRLRHVLGHEKIEADDSAISLIAREAAGSMRDAMSLLDQAIAWAGDRLVGDEVARVLGVASRTVLQQLAAALVGGHAEHALRLVAQLVDSGYDLAQVARDLLAVLRDLVVARVCTEPGMLLDLSDAERAATTELASRASADDLIRLHQGFGRSFDEITRSAAPRAALEMTLVRLSRRPPLMPLDELLERIADLEKRLGGGPPDGPAGGSRGSGPARPPSSSPNRPPSASAAPSSSPTSAAPAPTTAVASSVNASPAPAAPALGLASAPAVAASFDPGRLHGATALAAQPATPPTPAPPAPAAAPPVRLATVTPLPVRQAPRMEPPAPAPAAAQPVVSPAPAPVSSPAVPPPPASQVAPRAEAPQVRRDAPDSTTAPVSRPTAPTSAPVSTPAALVSAPATAPVSAPASAPVSARPAAPVSPAASAAPAPARMEAPASTTPTTPPPAAPVAPAAEAPAAPAAKTKATKAAATPFTATPMVRPAPPPYRPLPAGRPGQPGSAPGAPAVGSPEWFMPKSISQPPVNPPTPRPMPGRPQVGNPPPVSPGASPPPASLPPFPPSAPVPPTGRGVRFKPGALAHDPSKPMPKPAPGIDMALWQKVVDTARTESPSLAALLDSAVPARLGAAGVVLTVGPNSFEATRLAEPRYREALDRAVRATFDPTTPVTIDLNESAREGLTLARLRAAEMWERREAARKRVLEHPLVRAAIEDLGAELRDVRVEDDKR